MVGTPQLHRLLEVITAARAKTVLVGDPYQLGPVVARGGMFDQICDELPSSQRLSEAWRMRSSGKTARSARHCALTPPTPSGCEAVSFINKLSCRQPIRAAEWSAATTL